MEPIPRQLRSQTSKNLADELPSRRISFVAHRAAVPVYTLPLRAESARTSAGYLPGCPRLEPRDDDGQP